MALQDCYNTTDWNLFIHAATHNNIRDLQEYTETVTVYINKCIDDVTDTKTITVRVKQKWTVESLERCCQSWR